MTLGGSTSRRFARALVTLLSSCSPDAPSMLPRARFMLPRCSLLLRPVQPFLLPSRGRFPGNCNRWLTGSHYRLPHGMGSHIWLFRLRSRPPTMLCSRPSSRSFQLSSVTVGPLSFPVPRSNSPPRLPLDSTFFPFGSRLVSHSPVISFVGSSRPSLSLVHHGEEEKCCSVLRRRGDEWP